MIQPTHSNLEARSPLREEYAKELARLEQIESRLGTVMEKEMTLISLKKSPIAFPTFR